MINILIVDDNPEKQKKIKNAITSVLSEDDYINVESSVDVISAKKNNECKRYKHNDFRLIFTYKI